MFRYCGDNLDCPKHVKTATLSGKYKSNEIEESDVLSVFDVLKPKMEEAETNLNSDKSLKDVCTSFEIDEIVSATKENHRNTAMYPRLETSLLVWSGLFDKMSDRNKYNLTDAEQLALNMVNYLVYTESAYAYVVNIICYIFANTKSPLNFQEIDKKSDIVPITRNITLSHKVKFLKRNLPNIPSDVPDITKACDISLRNMIAHGRLAGETLPKSHTSQSKTEDLDASRMTYVQGGRPHWRWRKKHVDLDVAYAKMNHITQVWCRALQRYCDAELGS